MKTLGTKRESFSDLNSASQFLAKAIQESPQSVVHVMLGNVKVFFTDGSELYISVPMERSLLQAPVPKGQLIDLLIFNRFIEKSAHNLKTGNEVFSDDFARELIKKSRSLTDNPNRGKPITTQDFHKIKKMFIQTMNQFVGDLDVVKSISSESVEYYGGYCIELGKVAVGMMELPYIPTKAIYPGIVKKIQPQEGRILLQDMQRQNKSFSVIDMKHLTPDEIEKYQKEIEVAEEERKDQEPKKADITDVSEEDLVQFIHGHFTRETKINAIERISSSQTLLQVIKEYGIIEQYDSDYHGTEITPEIVYIQTYVDPRKKIVERLAELTTGDEELLQAIHIASDKKDHDTPMTAVRLLRKQESLYKVLISDYLYMARKIAATLLTDETLLQQALENENCQRFIREIRQNL
jgi:hypothetical protein